MTDWAPGMEARIVEHDPKSHEPKPGGRVLTATVTTVNDAFVAVKAENRGGTRGILGPLYFYVDGGWHAFDMPFMWRLLPGADEVKEWDGLR